MRGSIFAVIRLIAVKYSQVFDKGKFEKMGFWLLCSPTSRKLPLRFSVSVMHTYENRIF